MELYPIVIAVLVYLTTGALMWRSRSGSRLAAYVMFLYGLVAALGGVLYVLGYDSHFVPNPIAYVYVYTGTLILILPICKFGDKQKCVIYYGNKKFLVLYIYIMVAISFYGFLSFAPELSNRMLEAAGSEGHYSAYKNQRDYAAAKQGLSFSNIPVVIAGAISEVIPFFFFLAFTLRKHLALKIALAICIVFTIRSTVSVGGRNGLVLISITGIGLLLLFWGVFDKTVRKKMVGLLLVAFVMLWLVVINITRSRFKESEGIDPAESLIIYAGQPMLYCGDYIFKANALGYGDINFPVARAAMGLKYSTTLSIRNEIWEPRLDVPLGVFYTYLGDLALDFGVLVTVTICILLSSLSCRCIEAGVRIAKVHELFLVYALFLIVGQGVFYFKHKSMGGNLQLIYMMITYLVLRYIGQCELHGRVARKRGARNVASYEIQGIQE